MREKLLLLAPATLLAVTACNSKPQQPNIVFFLVDDLGYADLSYQNRSDFYETPNIDKFLCENLSFENSYAAASNSAPARACLMTGMYTPRHGIYTVNPPDRGEASKRKLIAAPNNDEITPQFYTLAEMLTDAGYNCAQIGKWHLGDDNSNTGPLSQGFQYNIAGEKAGTPFSYFFPYTNPKTNKTHIGLEEGTPGEYLTDRLTDEAVKFIKQDRGDTPFFLYLSHHGVHTPLKAPQELVEKYEQKDRGLRHNNAVYAAMIESVDNSFKTICQTLEELGVADNTIIVFYSDNGGSSATDNYPLRSMKGTPYEGGCRVPLAIKWSEKAPLATTVDIPVTGVDFYKTFAEELTGKAPEGLDGENIFTLIDENNYTRDIFWHFPAYLESYLDPMDFRSTPYSVIRSGDWKLIYFYETESCELYNLKEDISETINLAEENPQQRDELYRRLWQWLQATNAPTSFESNPGFRY
ncbi:MAG: sulfatase [Rikenellaceae bacterium]